VHFVDLFFSSIMKMHGPKTNKKIVEKIKTYVLVQWLVFFENCAVYEIRVICENIAVLGVPQMTVWRMRIPCWIPKSTNTRSEYAIHIVFPLQQWLHERAVMLHYTCIACLVFTDCFA